MPVATIPKTRVVFFNRSYWPDVEATGQLLTELTQDLAEDFDVEVVAGQPNCSNSDDTRLPPGLESHAGVTIRRLRHTQFRKHSFVGRLLNLLSFTFAAGWASFSIPRPDIVVTETDPFFLAFVGRWLQFRHRCRLVVHLQDIYPDIAIAVGKLREGMLVRLVRTLLFRVYRNADCVIVLSRDMRQTCIDYGVPASKILVIPNWADSTNLQPQKVNNQFRRQHHLEERFVVMYSGNLGLAHPLTPILDAAEILASDDKIRFVFVGDGARRQELESDCRNRKLPNVVFLPYQPRDTLAESLSAADVHLISMQPEATGFLMPSKLYGILASSTSVIILARPDCELAEFATKHDVGLVCNLVDEVGLGARLADSIRFLADRPEHNLQLGRNARHLSETHFDRRFQTSKFACMLAEVALSGRPKVGAVSQSIEAV